ncbi:hypothetical protein [Virgibacillus profundi]|uniref:hypothetical protein n=1 Tax=Virgibacillus profundi TaxID=2024555 RepID=UPI0013FE0519|nr:hypothetical protein [Virgibacillus profundi]
MNYESMWNNMKSTYQDRLTKLELEDKKGSSAWINAKRFVDVMEGIELNQPVSDGIDD